MRTQYLQAVQLVVRVRLEHMAVHKRMNKARIRSGTDKSSLITRCNAE